MNVLSRFARKGIVAALPWLAACGSSDVKFGEGPPDPLPEESPPLAAAPETADAIPAAPEEDTPVLVAEWKHEEIIEVPPPQVEPEVEAPDEVVVEAPPPPPPFSAGLLAVAWDCNAPGGDVPVVTIAQKIPAGADEFDLLLTGKICPPRKARRDVVFVVDVSGSMRANDPITNGTCARAQGVQAVIASLAQTSDLGVAVVTFSDSARVASSRFAANLADLESDIGMAAATALCDIQNGTNYRAGLEGAKTLLMGGRPTATKEVFFISDGAPSPGQDGKAIANELKTVGVGMGKLVTIGTLMLRGKDEVLAEFIASKDNAGRPFHVLINQANRMAEALAALTTNRVVASAFAFQEVGGVPNTSPRPDGKPPASGQGKGTLTLAQDQTSFTLSLPRLRRSPQSPGYVLSIEVKDSTGQVRTRVLNLKWD